MTGSHYHHGDLRNALLRAGRQALKTTPPGEVSLRLLAKEAGVSPNAPYRHFADRDALLTALSLEGFRDLLLALRESAAKSIPADRLAALADAYLGSASREPGLYLLMFRETTAAKDDDLLAAREELFAEIMATVDDDTPDDPEASLRSAVAIWATLHGSALLSIDGSLEWLDRWLRPSGRELAVAMQRGMVVQRGRGAR